MNRIYKFHWFALISLFIPLIIFICTTFISWWFLPPFEKQLIAGVSPVHLVYFLGTIGILMLGAGLTLVWLWHRYIIPVARLTEEVALIRSGNPSHRIKLAGSPNLQKLSEIINEWALQLESNQTDIESRITRARSESETQKNILAAFLAELPDGVIICNESGKILLYNKQAKLLFATNRKNDTSESDTEKKSYQIVGLGRWINDVINPYLIKYALDEIKSKLEKNAPDMAASFVIRQARRTLRVEASPILDHLRAFTGYVLIFYDITDALEMDGRSQHLWQSLTRHVRSAVTNIRSAIETEIEYPEMKADRRNQLNQLIYDETLILGKVLDDTTAEYDGCCTESRWPLVFIKDEALIDLIDKKIKDKLDIVLVLDTIRSVGWVRVDTYSITLALVFIIVRLKQATGLNQFSIRMKKTGRLIVLDIIWQGRAIKLENLKAWQTQPVKVGPEQLSFTLKEILEYHHMDIGSYPGKPDTDLPYIRIFIPSFAAPESVRQRSVAILPESRPEFFDFDLFHQSGQDEKSDNRRLDQLTYTVFDIETTGLDINGGDRIISIGAVRIVNAKLLKTEQFNQLVNPRRAIPPASTEFHGITDDMVVDQPIIEDVLPLFYQFVDETVLVAHNAAFDMRLLQINEPYTGLKFDNPVLDTLLLSAVVNPSQGDHDLEHIAKRLGVRVQGRHTAMGDALTTATIFLKLIPLLAQMGIHTLKDAREASQKTYFARLKY